MGAIYNNIGRRLESCDLALMNSRSFYVVIVSGDSPNRWGHAILNVGNQGGYYVHVSAGLHGYPTFMTQHEYEVYLSYYKKKELSRTYVHVPSPEKAILKIEQTLMDKWYWLVAFNNCTTFVEQVIRAGGGQWRFQYNLPCPNLMGCGVS